VPVCAGDAELIGTGAEPPVRKVEYDGSYVPYWEAGTQAYGQAYFAGHPDALAMFAAPRLGSHTSG
jgi:hypothetical protein